MSTSLSFSSLVDSHMRTAIRLKSALERVPTRLTSIGTIVNSIGLLADWQNQSEMSDDELEEWRVMKQGEVESEKDSDVEEEAEEQNMKEEANEDATDTACDTTAAVDLHTGNESGTGSGSGIDTDSATRIRMTNGICDRLTDLCNKAAKTVVQTEWPRSLRQRSIEINLSLTPDAEKTHAESSDGTGVTGQKDADDNDHDAGMTNGADDADSESVSDADGTDAISFSGHIDQVKESLMSDLWQHAHRSGFGDVKSQTTQVDLTVRNARELRTNEFEVDPDVMIELASQWSKELYPKRVRVEPYKINIYGPGGKFSVHRDTPQLGLVGTALVGLGDTTNRSAGLKLVGSNGDITWRAIAGSYVMFYPDVPHEVLKISTGYRATVAFKVYADVTQPNHAEIEKVKSQFSQQLSRLEQSIQYNSSYDQRTRVQKEISQVRSDQTKAIQALVQPNRSADENVLSDSIRATMSEQIRTELAQLQTPFGLLLDHRYGINSATLVGSDRLLYECLASMPYFRLTDFPVLTKYHAIGEYPGSHEGPELQKISVYPITDQHVNYVMELDDDQRTAKKRQPPTPGFGAAIATDIHSSVWAASTVAATSGVDITQTRSSTSAMSRGPMKRIPSIYTVHSSSRAHEYDEFHQSVSVSVRSSVIDGDCHS